MIIIIINVIIIYEKVVKKVTFLILHIYVRSRISQLLQFIGPLLLPFQRAIFHVFLV